MQLSRWQLLFQQLVRKGQAFAATVRGKPPLDEVGHDDEVELQSLRLMHGHQVDRVDRVIERRNLFVGLRGFRRVEVLEVSGEVVVRVFIAVAGDQFGEFLHVRTSV